MTIEGVDYAWQRPTVAGLVAAGKHFVVRYGGPGSSGKQLDAGEARSLIAAGLSIVANAEGASDGLLGGRAAGVAWAQSADQHFRALGMPADRPIYLSVDFDAGAAHWSRIDAALRGAAEVLGAARVGVYGGYATVAHCAAAGTARWLWQTYGWSSGRWHPGAHIRQYRNHVPLAGGTVDLCQAMTSDYGQWGQGEGGDMPTPDELWSWDGITNPYGDAASNPTIAPNTALRNIGGDTRAAAQTVARVEQTLAALTKAVAGIKGVDGAALQQQLADIRSAVDTVDEAVLDQLGTATQDPAETARVLRAALGDQLPAVLAELQRAA